MKQQRTAAHSQGLDIGSDGFFLMKKKKKQSPFIQDVGL
jgi:hypothetical protein